jgi:hypothetical protein
MRVSIKVESVRVYTFTKSEVTYLKMMGVWEFISTHLQDNERIEIEQSEGNLGNP